MPLEGSADPDGGAVVGDFEAMMVGSGEEPTTAGDLAPSVGVGIGVGINEGADAGETIATLGIVWEAPPPGSEFGCVKVPLQAPASATSRAAEPTASNRLFIVTEV